MAGRVFTEEELLRVGDFCERHDLTIVSDEIHSDLILDEGVRHISMLALDNGVRAADLSHLLPKQMHAWHTRERLRTMRDYSCLGSPYIF